MPSCSSTTSRTELQSARGRQASLNALQEAALADADEAVAGWLREQGLEDAPRLADQLEVEPGWEHALEAVLSGHLRAVCTDSLDRVGAAVKATEVDSLALLDTAAPEVPAPAGTLMEQVRSPWPLHGLLGSVRVAADLPAALDARGTLAPGEVLVTADGVLVGPNWLRTPEVTAPWAGCSPGPRSSRSWSSRSRPWKGGCGPGEGAGAPAGAPQRVEEEREGLRGETAGVNRSLANVRADLTGTPYPSRAPARAPRALQAEREELAERLEESLTECEDARERLHAALEEIETLADRRDEPVGAPRRPARTGDKGTRAGAGVPGAAHRLQVSIESRRASREARLRSLERAREQREQLRGAGRGAAPGPGGVPGAPGRAAGNAGRAAGPAVGRGRAARQLSQRAWRSWTAACVSWSRSATGWSRTSASASAGSTLCVWPVRSAWCAGAPWRSSSARRG